MIPLLVLVAAAVATSVWRGVRSLPDPEWQAASVWATGSQQQQQLGPCAFRLADGSQINLHWMMQGLKSTTLRAEEEGVEFSYSPCVRQACGQGDDRDGCLCRRDPQGGQPRLLGLLSSALLQTNLTAPSPHLSLQYANPERNVSCVVHLVCTAQASLTSSHLRVEADGNATFFVFSLLSPCACPNGCRVRPGMSVGTILVLVFFSLSILYFGIGFFFKKAVSGAQGVQALPNSSFWAVLPGLIRDGYLFFISPCLGQHVEYKYYDRL